MNKLSRLFIIIGLLLIVVSFSLVVFDSIDDYNAGNESSIVLDEMEHIINEQSQIALNNSDKNNTNNSNKNKVAKVNGYDYLGTITIPALNIKLPVMDRFDYARLKKSPCVYYGSLETNDLVIIAHRYKKHFGTLYQLQPKDKIIITDIYGNEYHYQVEVVEELDKYDIKEMFDNDFDLTLFTCTVGGLKRVTIRCNRIDKTLI